MSEHRFDNEVDGLIYCSRCGWWQGAAPIACDSTGTSSRDRSAQAAWPDDTPGAALCRDILRWIGMLGLDDLLVVNAVVRRLPRKIEEIPLGDWDDLDEAIVRLRYAVAVRHHERAEPHEAGSPSTSLGI